LTDTTEIIEARKPIDFKRRFIKSLISPWTLVVIGLLVIISFSQPHLWIVTGLLTLTFVLMNYKAMGQYLMRMKLVDNELSVAYLSRDNEQKSIQIPLNKLKVDYFGNGKGISSLVGDHLRIEIDGKTELKQYVTIGWTVQDLKETTLKLIELKKTNANIGNRCTSH